jgi:ribosome-binding ATPase YchF (GTP1/OBG family)
MTLLYLISSLSADSAPILYVPTVPPDIAANLLKGILESAFNLLNLISFFTVGPKECHAWILKKGLTAPKGAGVIHTDFEKGFISAKTISYDDYIKYNGEEGAKTAGKLRSEGKEYTVQDGDVFHFMFNV